MNSSNIYNQSNSIESNSSAKLSAVKPGWALGLGIAAATLPIPVIDILFATIGFVLLYLSRKEGYEGGLWIAGLVLNIIGMLFAIILNIGVIGILLYL